uniref:Uncharacterized protein n=1 Tax=Palpitomonas bilix TaxID=652834 RepID=A0A7S3DIS1_9EUKA
MSATRLFKFEMDSCTSPNRSFGIFLSFLFVEIAAISHIRTEQSLLDDIRVFPSRVIFSSVISSAWPFSVVNSCFVLVSQTFISLSAPDVAMIEPSVLIATWSTDVVCPYRVPSLNGDSDACLEFVLSLSKNFTNFPCETKCEIYRETS